MHELIGNPAIVGVGVVSILLMLITALLNETLVVGRTHLRMLADKDEENKGLREEITGLKREIQALTDLAFRLTGHAELATKTATSILGKAL